MPDIDHATTRRRPANAGKHLPAETLSPEEVGRLLATCDPSTPSGLRDRAMAAVLYRCGLKPSEALALQTSDVDRLEHCMTVGTRLQRRVVGLDRECLRLLDAWLGARAGLKLPAAGPLFCSLEGNQIAPSYVRMLLPRLADRAGIAKRVHAQAFRQTHAAELIREGWPLPLIQEQLGLSSLGVTETYLRSIDIELPDRVAAMKQRAWKAMVG